MSCRCRTRRRCPTAAARRKGRPRFSRRPGQLERWDGRSDPGAEGIYTWPAIDCSRSRRRSSPRSLRRSRASCARKDAGRARRRAHGHLGVIRGYLDAGIRDFGVVQIDAHADLRDRYEGDPLSHASVMRQSRRGGHSAVPARQPRLLRGGAGSARALRRPLPGRRPARAERASIRHSARRLPRAGVLHPGRRRHRPVGAARHRDAGARGPGLVPDARALRVGRAAAADHRVRSARVRADPAASTPSISPRPFSSTS